MQSRGRGPTPRTVVAKTVRTKNKRPRSRVRVEELVNPYANRTNFRPNLQPFVETKRDQSGVSDGALQTVNAFTVLQCPSLLYRAQGIGDRQMIGSSCYGRYLGYKLRLMFPRHDDAIDIPTSLHVYFCTVEAPFARTANTTPTVGAVTKLQLEEHIADQLQQFFDKKNERMEFMPRLQGFRVDKHVEVKPDRDSQIGRPQSNIGGGAAVGSGGPPDVFVNHSWAIKQKLHYQLADTQLGADTHYLNRPDACGYKCVVIYNPDFAGQDGTTDTKISFQANDQMWFGDQ